MKRVQQNILISSSQRSNGSSASFTVRLERPIDNVVRTDLRELIIAPPYANSAQALINAQALSDAQALNTDVLSMDPDIQAALQTAITANDALITAQSNLDNNTDENAYGILSELLNDAIAAVDALPNTLAVSQTNADESTAACTAAYNALQIEVAKVLSFDAQLEATPYIGIQSPQLGNTVDSSTNISLYDVVPFVGGSLPFVYQRSGNRVDKDVYGPKVMLYQFDVRFIYPDGSLVDYGDNEVNMLLEVITES